MSGGEKIKLQLARLMIGHPDVLLLDEPSNDLDIDTVRWLEEFIQESKIPILYISHDEVLLENTANKIIHIEQIKRNIDIMIQNGINTLDSYKENTIISKYIKNGGVEHGN